MSKTHLQRIAEIVHAQLLAYKDAHEPLRSAVIRREIAIGIAQHIRDIVLRLPWRPTRKRSRRRS